jgi:hypothetical protein
MLVIHASMIVFKIAYLIMFHGVMIYISPTSLTQPSIPSYFARSGGTAEVP